MKERLPFVRRTVSLEHNKIASPGGKEWKRHAKKSAKPNKELAKHCMFSSKKRENGGALFLSGIQKCIQLIGKVAQTKSKVIDIFHKRNSDIFSKSRTFFESPCFGLKNLLKCVQ